MGDFANDIKNGVRKNIKYSIFDDKLSEEEKRNIELSLMRPDPILKPFDLIFENKTTVDVGLGGRTVHIVFKSNEILNKFKKYFHIRYDKRNNVNFMNYDGLLEDIVELLESGKIEYDGETKRIRK